MVDEAEKAKHVIAIRAVFESLEQSLLAIPETEIAMVNLDAKKAMSVGRAVAKNLAPLRARFAALPEFDIDAFDRLESYADAFEYAELAVHDPADRVAELVEDARAVRKTLLTWGAALAHAGILPADQIKRWRGRKRELTTLAADCMGLHVLFDSAWSRIEGKSAVRREDVEHAGVVGVALIEALGGRQVRHAHDAAEMRSRAYTLFVRKYEEVRRGATFLFWYREDVDDIVPSLFRGRGNTRAARARASAGPADASKATPRKERRSKG